MDWLVLFLIVNQQCVVMMHLKYIMVSIGIYPDDEAFSVETCCNKCCT